MKRKIGEPFGGTSQSSALFQIAEIVRKAGMIDHPGDSILAHITPEEANVLKKRGGAGKRNKVTGALSFYEEGNDGNDGNDNGDGSDSAGDYGGRDEGDRGRAAAESGGAGGFGSGSLGGGDGGNNAGVNTGETYGPSAADFGLAADAWGPADGVYGGLTGRDAYGSRPGPGGTPTTGDVYAGYSPPGTYDVSSFGTQALSAIGSLVAGPLGGLLGYGIGSMAFGPRSAPEMGSKIGHDSSMDASTSTSGSTDPYGYSSTSGFGSTGTPTTGEQWSGSDRVGDRVPVSATEITQAMPQTVLQPAVAQPAVSPWRTYQPPQINWATYGEGPGASFYDRVNPLTNKFAGGGTIPQTPLRMASGGALMGLVDGPGDGESDSVPVQMPSGEGGALSGGEYIVPAADVAAIGNGSSMAGARTLDGILMNVRRAHIDHLSQKPPPRR